MWVIIPHRSLCFPNRKVQNVNTFSMDHLKQIRDLRFEISRLDEKINQLERRKKTCLQMIDKHKRQMEENDRQRILSLDQKRREMELAWKELDNV